MAYTAGGLMRGTQQYGWLCLARRLEEEERGRIAVPRTRPPVRILEVGCRQQRRALYEW